MHHFPQLHQSDAEPAVLAAMDEPGFRVFQYPYCQTYLPDMPVLELLVITLVDTNARALAVIPRSPDALQQLVTAKDARVVRAWLQERAVGIFTLGQALDLAPVFVPKPWGQEVWFTGIEARGQSQFADPHGHCLPIPWLLSLLPKTLLGDALPALTLLKILDPLPEPVFGDLYFEMHEEKQEVYVVTGIDPRAWPDGRGGIRFGFDQAVRRQYTSDEAFRKAYLTAVADYEKVRRAIDKQIDALRQADGFGVNEPVSANQQKQWLAKIDGVLRSEEDSARRYMDSFARVLPLSLGDVVKVPCYTPHSLLHGVTTVEFQTPVYERKILSFAQKVLTQGHWDTAEAMGQINLDAPVNPPLAVLHKDKGVLREQVVRFDDFAVQRVTLTAASSWSLDGGQYALLMVLAGESRLQGRALVQGQAVFLPAGINATLVNTGEQPLVLLVSEPV